MTNKLHHPVLRYGFAVVSIAVGISVRLLLDPVLGNTLPFATLFVAVLLTAWYGGLRPALLAVVLGAFAANYFLLLPRGRVIWADLEVQVGLLLFLATGFGIALLGGAMHDAKQWAETRAAALREVNEQLEARVSERTADLARTNESMRTSEARMGGIVNSAMDAIISVDRKQHIVVFNAAAEKMFHCSAAKAMGQSLDLFIPERFREQHSRHVEGFGKTGATSRSMRSLGTLSGLRTDGEEFPIEASISQIEVAGKNIYTVILRDITERQHAENAVRQSEDRLDFGLQVSGTGAWDLDLLDHSTRRSLQHDRIFGYQTVLPTWTLEMFMEHVLSEDRSEVNRLFSQAISDKGDWSFECRIRRADGQVRWIWASGRHRFDESGVARRMSGIVQDITERKQAQEALQASELRYRRLFESAKDGILILDADSGQIVDVNPFLIEMLGYSKEDLMGKKPWEIGVFKDVLGSKAAFEKLQQQGYIRYENLPLESRAGLVRQVEFVSNTYLAGEGRVIQCNIRDITARKLAEEALRETNRHLEQALEELQEKTHELTTMTQQLWQASKLATMGELAASVAHELNNPLATMALRAEMLVERSQDESSRTSAQIVLNEVERMAGLVENLLQFSRRSYRQISTVDVAEEISNSVNFISYYLRNRSIKIVTEFAAGVPTIQADRQQLRQLFLNLLTNAADAMPDGGTLITRTVPIKLGEAESVLIEFIDSGVGISDAILDRIWDSFFTTKPEGKGTGLGLAICRRIAEEHGGMIAIDGKLGEGARVRITLPATANGVHKMKPEKVLVAQ